MVLKIINFLFKSTFLLSCNNVESAVRVGVDPVVRDGAVVARGRLGTVGVEEDGRRHGGVVQVD